MLFQYYFLPQQIDFQSLWPTPLCDRSKLNSISHVDIQNEIERCFHTTHGTHCQLSRGMVKVDLWCRIVMRGFIFTCVRVSRVILRNTVLLSFIRMNASFTQCITYARKNIVTMTPTSCNSNDDMFFCCCSVWSCSSYRETLRQFTFHVADARDIGF